MESRGALPRLIGMVHLGPLPGSPRFAHGLNELESLAIADALTLQRAGFDAVMIENYGDLPFFAHRVPAETVAAMAVLASAIQRAVSLPIGINVLRNDAGSALAVAAACRASFIRVNVLCGATATDQGIIQGQAAKVLRRRAQLCPGVAILADVHVKHGRPLGDGDLVSAARDTAYRGLADGLILSGGSTGAPTDLDSLRSVRSAVPDRPLYVGSGATAQTVRGCLAVADGVIVGTSVKTGGVTQSPVDFDRAREFVNATKG